MMTVCSERKEKLFLIVTLYIIAQLSQLILMIASIINIFQYFYIINMN